jgi:pre-mRNA-splicing factor RBM22/SLT11
VEQLRTFAALEPGPVLRPKRDTPLTPEEHERLRQSRLAEVRPPADTTITSLHVGSVPPGVKARDLMPLFLPYGPVRSISRDTSLMSALVTYHRRADAESACRALHASLTVRGTRLRLMWARRRAPGGAAVLPEGAEAGAFTQQPRPQPKRPLLPPGVAPPPGVRAGSGYDATDPEASGARPDLG